MFNYDVPQDDEFYVHRIGRTGRAGRVGKAFTFVVGREVYKLKDIQRYCKTKIYAQPIPSLNDITAIRLEKVLDEIDHIIKNEDLNRMTRIIEQKLNEEDYTAMDIAAAFLKQALGENEQNNDRGHMEDFGDTGAEEAWYVSSSTLVKNRKYAGRYSRGSCRRIRYSGKTGRNDRYV